MSCRIANGYATPITVTLVPAHCALEGSDSMKIRISSGRYVDVPSSSCSLLRASVSAGRGEPEDLLVETFDLPERRNMVVDARGQVHLTRPGCTWVDEEGRHHWLCLGGHLPLVSTRLVQAAEKVMEQN